MHSRKGGGNAYEIDPNAGATLFVNLFMLLLAFFVVLVALSEIIEERSEQAINSIAQVFSITVDATEDTVESPKHRASGISDAFVLDVIRTIVDSEVKVIEPTQIESNANYFYVRYNIVDLFQSNSTIIRPDKLIVLRRIAHSAFLSSDPVYVTTAISTPTINLSGSFTFGVPQAAKRVEHLIDLLLREGVPSHNLQANIVNDDEEYVEFSFTLESDHFPNIKIVPRTPVE